MFEKLVKARDFFADSPDPTLRREYLNSLSNDEVINLCAAMHAGRDRSADCTRHRKIIRGPDSARAAVWMNPPGAVSEYLNEYLSLNPQH